MADDGKQSFSAPTTKEFAGHRKKIHTTAWSNNGRKLATGSADCTARVWSVEHSHGRELELKGHTSTVEQLTWDPTLPDHLASISSDRTLRMWDTRSGKMSQVLPTTHEPDNIAWSPDGRYLAVGTKDDYVCVFDARKNKLLEETNTEQQIFELVFDGSADLLYVSTGVGSVDIYTQGLEKVHSLQAHSSHCYSLKIGGNNQFLLTGGADAVVTLWSTAEMICLKSFNRYEFPVRIVGINHTSEYFLSACEEASVDISNLETGETVHQLQLQKPGACAAWSPTRNIVAYGGDEKDKRDDYVIKVASFQSA